MNFRAQRILAAVIGEYLATGEPVGSLTVARRPGIDVSAATVRTVFAELEAAGLLSQPHTSAGRVPTDLGLRHYVQSLLRTRPLSPRERDEIRSRYPADAGEPEAVAREASRVLAGTARQVALVVTPRPEHEVVSELRFVPLRSGELLALVVTQSGQVFDRVLPARWGLAPADLERVHDYLNRLLGGLTLHEVRARVFAEMAREKGDLDSLVGRALAVGAASLPEPGPRVFVEGQSHVVDAAPEPARIRALLQALEDKETLLRLLDSLAAAPGVQVVIGAERLVADLSGCSLVVAAFGGDEGPRGLLGVIGPTRMNYARLIPLVGFSARVVAELLGKRP